MICGTSCAKLSKFHIARAFGGGAGVLVLGGLAADCYVVLKSARFR